MPGGNRLCILAAVTGQTHRKVRTQSHRSKGLLARDCLCGMSPEKESDPRIAGLPAWVLMDPSQHLLIQSSFFDTDPAPDIATTRVKGHLASRIIHARGQNVIETTEAFPQPLYSQIGFFTGISPCFLSRYGLQKENECFSIHVKIR